MADSETPATAKPALARQLAQPWWLHAPVAASPPASPPRHDLREFAGMVARISLAAWMLGTALAWSYVPIEQHQDPGSSRLDRDRQALPTTVSAVR